MFMSLGGKVTVEWKEGVKRGLSLFFFVYKLYSAISQ